MGRWIARTGLTCLLLASSAAFAGKPSQPPPPPAAPAIAFTSSLWGGDLLVMNADGTNQTVVLAAKASKGRTAGYSHQDPSWSPDGSQIVFASNVAGAGVYVINRDGSGLHKIASTSAVSMVNPVWSPAPVPGIGGDRYRIAFVDVGAGGTGDLWIADVDGGSRTNVSATSDVEEFFPTWSPSASRLVCQTFMALDGSGNAAVRDHYGLFDFGAGTYTTNPYGGAFTGHYVRRPMFSNTLESVLAVEVSMDWSPSASNWTWDLWRVDLTNPSGYVDLTNTPTNNEMGPTWSPDDALLALVTWNGIAVMNADGSGLHSVESGGGEAAWRRDP